MLLLSFSQIVSLPEGIHSSNSLTSIPPQVNGRITACVGDEISLTCSRNNIDFPVTEWIISSPVNCSSNINHISQTASPCEPFTFENITEREGSITLNSTAVATATSEINGSIIECVSGIVEIIFIGSTSLCVIGKLSTVVYKHAFCDSSISIYR